MKYKETYTGLIKKAKNEYRTYLRGKCPKCDSKEVTGSRLINECNHYYYKGKCHKCGCNFVEYHHAYYVGTCIKKDYLIQSIEMAFHHNDLIKCESKCPKCKTENIDINNTDFINSYNLFAKKCKCKKCGQEFNEWYSLYPMLTTYYNENNEEVIKYTYFGEWW